MSPVKDWSIASKKNMIGKTVTIADFHCIKNYKKTMIKSSRTVLYVVCSVLVHFDDIE
jgi:hypothetical protein